MRRLNGKMLRDAMLACALTDEEKLARKRANVNPTDRSKGTPATNAATNETFVLATHGLTSEELALRLKNCGFPVEPRIVSKWRKSLQPPLARIELVEQVLGFVVSEDLPQRRKFGDPQALIAA